MDANKYLYLSKIAGVLIILGMLVGILSIVPVVESEQYFQEAYPNRTQVLTGAVFQFLLVPLYIGFALLLYPLLSTTNQSLSIGFIGFRMMAGIFQLIGMILLPLFMLLSQIYLKASHPDLLFFETTGTLLKSARDLTNHLGVMLPTGLGNLLLYYILYKGNHIPRWLSLWGTLGNLLLMLGSFLLLFQWIKVISIEYGLITIPLVLQEVVLAGWLTVKGLKLEVESGGL